MTAPYRSLRSALTALAALLALPAVQVQAQTSDQALQTHHVAGPAYAIQGPFGNRTAENLGNNATFGFIVTEAGVVLIDSGGTYKGAAAIDEQIRTVTDQPVRWVINTGGQDHRWLGNGYFKSRGATLIANTGAVADQKARVQDQFFRLGELAGAAALEGTEPVYAGETFETQHVLEAGGVRLEIHHAGQAHTPGDSFVWLPEHKVMFSGDIVYVGRMLGVMDHSNSRSWMAAFEAMAAFEPEHLVPGHGPVTTLETARADSYAYLSFLRESVEAFMDAGGTIDSIGEIDQSRFAYLNAYDSLKGRNIQQVFQEMEWE
ncbi:MAG: MBL fold metallo-hydrolase [Gammaproteobacteria bacterium]